MQRNLCGQLPVSSDPDRVNAGMFKGRSITAIIGRSISIAGLGRAQRSARHLMTRRLAFRIRQLKSAYEHGILRGSLEPHDEVRPRVKRGKPPTERASNTPSTLSFPSCERFAPSANTAKEMCIGRK